jgi:hypothetical protein
MSSFLFDDSPIEMEMFTAAKISLKINYLISIIELLSSFLSFADFYFSTKF